MAELIIKVSRMPSSENEIELYELYNLVPAGSNLTKSPQCVSRKTSVSLSTDIRETHIQYKETIAVSIPKRVETRE